VIHECFESRAQYVEGFLAEFGLFCFSATLYHVFNCTTNCPNLKGVKIVQMFNKFGFILPFYLCLVKDKFQILPSFTLFRLITFAKLIHPSLVDI